MSARDLATKVKPGSTVRWDRLERAAFAAHLAFPETSGAKKRLPGNNWNLIWGIPLVILYLFCYLAPVWGTAAISVSRFNTYRQPAEDRIPLAGTLFIFALVLLVVSIVHWFVAGRGRNGFYEVQAALGLTLGGLSAAAVRMHGLRESVADWQIWIIPIIATVVLAAIFLVLLVVAHLLQGARSSKTDDGGGELPRNRVELLKQRREQVALLSDSARAAITADLESAFSDLERRGLISADEAERARGAELGGLALRMPRARGSAQPPSTWQT